MNRENKNTRTTINLDKVNGPKKYQKLITYVGLFLIFLFALFLRSEHFFSKWQKAIPLVQYNGEYQMVNFDSYYYLQAAKEIKNGTYDTFDERRHIPNGVERSFFPPLLSALAVGISYVTTQKLATVALFIPVFLGPLLALVIFLIARRFDFNRLASLTAALFSIISLTYVIRTSLGVFDTDCLNVTFLLLNSYLFLSFTFIENKKRSVYLIAGLISTFLYYIWWNSATSVVIFASLVPLFVGLIFFYKTQKPIIKYGVLGLLILLSALLLYDQIEVYSRILFGQADNVFFLNQSIGELDFVNLHTFIKETVGNDTVFVLMIVGLFFILWTHKLKTLFFAVPIILALLPFFAGNRFLIFSAPILALGMGGFVQMLFHYKKHLKPAFTYVIVLFISILGVYSNHKRILSKLEKPPAAYDNIALLNALKKYSPENANIWTNWDIGYQVNYYLDKKTYADDGFSDGEIFYYLYFPMYVDNLAVAANFMRFYSVQGKKGIHKLYKVFSNEVTTFLFFKNIFQRSPQEAKKWLQTLEQKNQLPKVDSLTNADQWVLFLYPKNAEDIYLLLHEKMSQTASWFKQGGLDLKSKKEKGLPLFLQLKNLKKQGDKIKNDQIALNTRTGESVYNGAQKNYFQSITTFKNPDVETVTFNKNKTKTKNRFVFNWIQNNGYGAIMSQEMANTTFVKLYMQHEKSVHFQPVLLNTPEYQIWKIPGNTYEIE